MRLIGSTRFEEQRGSLRQYLYGIVRNLVRQREHWSDREVDWDADYIPKFTIVGFADSLRSQQLNEAVQTTISPLPPLQREAIVLCEFEELSLIEAAAVTGTDVGTIKSRLHRAREGLRHRLAVDRYPGTICCDGGFRYHPSLQRLSTSGRAQAARDKENPK